MVQWWESAQSPGYNVVYYQTVPFWCGGDGGGVKDDEPAKLATTVRAFVSVKLQDTFKESWGQFTRYFIMESQTIYSPVCGGKTGCFQGDLRTFRTVFMATKTGVLSRTMMLS